MPVAFVWANRHAYYRAAYAALFDGIGEPDETTPPNARAERITFKFCTYNRKSYRMAYRAKKRGK